MNALGFRALRRVYKTLQGRDCVDADHLFNVFKKKFGEKAVREHGLFAETRTYVEAIRSLKGRV